jgi:hypothetical protein
LKKVRSKKADDESEVLLNKGIITNIWQRNDINDVAARGVTVSIKDKWEQAELSKKAMDKLEKLKQ